jgi:hypothetical protein
MRRRCGCASVLRHSAACSRASSGISFGNLAGFVLAFIGHDSLLKYIGILRYVNPEISDATEYVPLLNDGTEDWIAVSHVRFNARACETGRFDERLESFLLTSGRHVSVA